MSSPKSAASMRVRFLACLLVAVGVGVVAAIGTVAGAVPRVVTVAPAAATAATAPQLHVSGNTLVDAS